MLKSAKHKEVIMSTTCNINARKRGRKWTGRRVKSVKDSNKVKRCRKKIGIGFMGRVS